EIIFLRARPLVGATAPPVSIGCFSASADNEGRPLCRCKCARPNLAALLGQAGVSCRKHRFVVVIRQSCEETANSAKRLTQEQIGGGVIRRSRISVSTRELNFAVLPAEDTSRSEEIHRRVRNPLLDKLHIQNRLAIGD